MTLRFAFDLGTASLGWAIYSLDNNNSPDELIDCGVRIFSDGRDPMSGEANATARREPRGMRRSRDRYLQRRLHLMKTLIDTGLMPPDEEPQKELVDLNPYELRARSLQEKIPLHHIGRALFHINQRRGFKSNRKTDDPDEKGKVSDAAKRLTEKLKEQGHETFGAFLYARQSNPDVRKRLPVRIRMDADNKEQLYEFYPLRQMLEDEFDLICQRQKELNPDFPQDTQIARVREAIFFQRPLREVLPGYCSFYDDQHRLARAHPLAEDWVHYQKVNQLRIEDEGGYSLELSVDQRDEMIAILKTGADLTWAKVRKIMGLAAKTGRINHEEGGEKNIVGSNMAKRFRGTPRKPGPFLEQWERFSTSQIEQILQAYNNGNTDEELLAALEILDLNQSQQALALKCSLPDGYVSVCQKAASQIVDELKKQVITYAKACELAGLHHSDKRDGEVFDQLPYYNMIDEMKRHLGHNTGDPKDPRDKRYGRIANPTVHIGLNQLRRTINALMDKYGRPDQIVLELSRELKQSKRQKEEYSKKRDQFKKANDKRREKLEDLGLYRPGDRRRTREAFIRMRLWEELAESPNDRKCPYSGRPIFEAQLMSDEIEIEHILPRSRTLDDSMANKTVAYREWNRLKRNLTPSEAAEHYPDKFNQEEMIARTKTMPANKRWRYHPDAKERFDDDEQFLARQLKETQYLGTVARHYLSKINPGDPQQSLMKVWVTTGRLTAELRRKWGLNLGTNYKNRNDHRHHALDACVIGVIDVALVQKIAKAAGRDEDNQGVDRILAHIEEPFDGFSNEVNAHVQKIIISHRSDHSIGGQLHKDAAYGPVHKNDENSARGEPALGNMVVRRPVSSLTSKQIGQVRDLKIRGELMKVLELARQEWPDKKTFDKQFPARLTQWSKDSGTRRVRTLKPESTAVPIGRRKDGLRYKYVAPGTNHHMDIVQTPDGKWHGITQTVFDANQSQQTSDWRSSHPDAKFIMCVHKGDMLQLLDSDGTNRIKRVVIIHESNNCLWLCNHQDAGKLTQRHKDSDDPFRWDFANINKLKNRRARRVRIDPTGRIRTIPYGKK